MSHAANDFKSDRGRGSVSAVTGRRYTGRAWSAQCDQVEGDHRPGWANSAQGQDPAPDNLLIGTKPGFLSVSVALNLDKTTTHHREGAGRRTRAAADWIDADGHHGYAPADLSL